MRVSLGKNKTSFSIVRLFSVVLIAIEVIYWLMQVVTRGSGIEFNFCNYTEHLFGNDYFFPMAAGQYDDPWTSTGLNYPAGAILLGRVVLHILPSNSIYEYGSAEYQTFTYSVASLMLMFFIGMIILFICVMKAVHAKETDRLLLSGALALSAPMMFEWISGNYILIAAGLTFVFLLLYDSPKQSVRIFSYLILGIAASIKLYPAAFCWIILLERRSIKEFFTCLFIVVALTIAPFFLYNGFDSIGAFLNNLFSESDIKSDWGMGYNYSLQNTVKILSFLIGDYIFGSIPMSIKLLIVGILLVQTFVLKQKWKRIFLISLCFIWFFDYSYAYTLLFLVPALCLYLTTESDKTSYDGLEICIFIGYILIFSPIPLPGVDAAQLFISNISPDAAFIYPLSWGHVLTAFGILLIEFILLIESIKYCFKRLSCLNKRFQQA